MGSFIIPEGYKAVLNVYEMQRAIEFTKQNFPKYLCAALNLRRVSAPLFVGADTGLNDDLNGIERPVSFDVPAADGKNYQIVHSLAKWKRLALKRYDFHVGKGLYTDMNAVRRDEDVLDNLHSVYVDQWDWEKVMADGERNIEYLKDTVRRIVKAIYMTSEALKWEFPQIKTQLNHEVTFFTSQELEDMYPDMTSKERENTVAKKYGTVFIMQIGKTLRSGRKHDGRAPDYDDWELNGDILFYNSVLDSAIEISSMGIRVNPESLRNQLKAAGCEKRLELPFHKMLANGELPQTIGGGIGQSRLCLLLMGCAHIGEVQSGVWDSETYEKFAEAGIILL